MEIIVELLISMAFSAFFSGMEIAFVSSNKLRFEMEKSNSIPNRILSLFYKNPNNFISTMLVGNNIALVIYGILMAQIIEIHLLGDIITNEALLVIIQTIISTLIILITGEFMPKTIFRINPNLTLKIFSIPTYICYITLYPISKFSTLLSTGILRITGHKIKKEDSEKAFSKVDLDYLIESSIDESENEKDIEPEIQIFKNALDFSSIKAKDCMIPRTEIIAIDAEASREDIMKEFINTGLSKLIVFKGDIDNVIGYIHSSEMFTNQSEWQRSIKSAPIVPETIGANKLMKQLMQSKKSLAVIVDEFGGTSGIITLEDLVEELLGDIEDEHDNKSTIAKAIKDNEFVLSARLEIEKINELFGLNLPESDEYQTLGGLILNKHQSIPKPNEVITFDDLQFKIIKATTTKIELVKLKIQK